MNISKLGLLLLIPLITCVNTKVQNAQDDNLTTESKIEKGKIVEFNTSVRGTGGPTIILSQVWERP